MNQVYKWAKCVDFSEDDYFRTFKNLSTFDPRLNPQACEDSIDITAGIIALSKNAGNIFVEPENAPLSYTDLMRFTNKCKDVPPIPTGVQVIYVEKTVESSIGDVLKEISEEYPEMICPNPGCYYDKNKKKCQN